MLYFILKKMQKMRTKKMLTFMVVGAVGLASLWVLGNGASNTLEIISRPTLTGITLKQLNLGNENITEWKMNDDTLTVHPKGGESTNTTKNGASQVGGIGNKAHGYTGDISKDPKDDEKYTDRPAFSSVIVVGSDNETSPGARYGAIVASQASSIIANPEGAVVLAAKNAKARGMNSSIVASANESEGQLVVAGSGAAVIASNNANVAEKAEGSLAIGNNISLTHSGVFAFNTKGQNLKSAKDDSFIVNVDYGFLIGKDAPGAPAGTVPLQVNGAIRVATADSQTPENAIVLKTKNLKGNQYSCLCINKEGEGMSLSPTPECNTVCGGKNSSGNGSSTPSLPVTICSTSSFEIVSFNVRGLWTSELATYPTLNHDEYCANFPDNNIFHPGYTITARLSLGWNDREDVTCRSIEKAWVRDGRQVYTMVCATQRWR